MTTTRTSLKRMTYNLFIIRDKKINFLLCQFQNRNSKCSFCKYNSNLRNWHRTKFIFMSLILGKLYLILVNLFSNSHLVLVSSTVFLCLVTGLVKGLTRWGEPTSRPSEFVWSGQCKTPAFHAVESFPSFPVLIPHRPIDFCLKAPWLVAQLVYCPTLGRPALGRECVTD